MQFSLNMGGWSSVFAVPTSLVDKHIKLAGENEIKVLLWLLRHGGLSASQKTIAEKLSIDKDMVEDAVDYWVQCGLIVSQNGKLQQCNESIKPVTKTEPKPQDVVEKPDITSKRMLRPNSQQVAQRLLENSSLSELLHSTESILGRSLSPALSAVLINAHDDYGLPAEVILMMMTYCKSIHKTTTPYIESLTKNWANEGVFSLELAEHKIHELNTRVQCWKKFSAIIELPHRAPSKNELEATVRWFDEMYISQELIQEAYNRCIDKIGKYNIKYMNAIIESWHTAKIATLKDLQDLEAKNTTSISESKTTYDISDFDKLDLFNNNGE